MAYSVSYIKRVANRIAHHAERVETYDAHSEESAVMAVRLHYKEKVLIAMDSLNAALDEMKEILDAR